MKSSKKENRMALLMRLLRGSVRFFVLSILCTTLVALVEMIVPNIISMTVDSVIGDQPLELPFYFRAPLEAMGADLAAVPAYFAQRLWLLAILVAALALLAGVFRYFSTLTNTIGSETLVEGMRNRLFHHLQQLPFQWHNQNQTGDLIQRCTNDVDMVRNFVSMQLISVFRIVILMALSLVFMFSIYPKLALVAVATFPVIMFYSVVFRGKIEKMFFEYDENEGKLSAIAQENLTGVRVVRAFGRERTEVEKFEAQNELCTKLNLRLSKLMSAFWAVGDLILRIAGHAGAGVGHGVHRARRDDHRQAHRLHVLQRHAHLARARAWPRGLGDVQGGRVHQPRGPHSDQQAGAGRSRRGADAHRGRHLLRPRQLQLRRREPRAGRRVADHPAGEGRGHSGRYRQRQDHADAPAG